MTYRGAIVKRGSLEIPKATWLRGVATKEDWSGMGKFRFRSITPRPLSFKSFSSFRSLYLFTNTRFTAANTSSTSWTVRHTGSS